MGSSKCFTLHDNCGTEGTAALRHCSTEPLRHCGTVAGAAYPNGSTITESNWISDYHLKCGMLGCLFNLATDYTEQHEVRTPRASELTYLPGCFI